MATRLEHYSLYYKKLLVLLLVEIDKNFLFWKYFYSFYQTSGLLYDCNVISSIYCNSNLLFCFK